MNITTEVYRPGTGLDNELAQLGYAAMYGWPDQRPVTGALVRSRLRPQGGAAATTLLLARTPGGDLAGAAALRHPAAAGRAARLWGPVIAPHRQRRGLGAALLEQAMAGLDDPATVVRTAEIPAVRRHAGAFFARAGWHLHSAAVLLRAPIGASLPMPDVRFLEPDDAASLAQLYHAAHPEHGWGVAADTYARWGGDERFTPDGLLGVDAAASGGLRAAVLVYPLAHSDAGEPIEALLADVLIHAHATAAEATLLTRLMVMAAMAAGARCGARVVRAIVPAASILLSELRALGFHMMDEIRYYQAPHPCR
ncbi:hypothetical protein ACFV1N_25495 [Streptosporangium canum]|uniref:hypothetical protein n=1 Tax=Streptosporangium canum TaxID=324952 RepID=UPI0036B9727D